MPVDSHPSSHPIPPITWTTLAGWCTLIGAVWLLIMLGWVWLDNHGEPWIWWAFGFAVVAPGFFTLFSALAWRGRRWVRKAGWWLLGLYTIVMLRHIFYSSHGHHWAWHAVTAESDR